MIGWVSSGVPVRFLGQRQQRVDGGELAGGGVVVAGSEVDVAGFGVVVLAVVAEEGLFLEPADGVRFGFAVGVVGEGAFGGAVGVGDEPDRSEVILVEVHDVACAGDLVDRGSLGTVDQVAGLGSPVLGEQQGEAA